MAISLNQLIEADRQNSAPSLDDLMKAETPNTFKQPDLPESSLTKIISDQAEADKGKTQDQLDLQARAAEKRNAQVAADDAERNRADYLRREREADSSLELAGKWFQNLPARAKTWMGGLAQSLAESSASPPGNFPLTTSEREQMASDMDAGLAEVRSRGAIPGQQLRQRGQQELAANAPNFGNSEVSRYIYEIGNAVVDLGAAAGVGILTRSPAAGSSVVAGQVWGDRYGESRESGRTVEQSLMDASFYSVAEFIPERIALGKIMAPGGKFLGRVAKGAAAEGIQESVTQILQMGYDVGVLDESMTFEEAVQQLKDAAIIGAGAGGVIGGVTTPFVREPAKSEPQPDRSANQSAVDAFNPSAPSIDDLSLIDGKPNVPLTEGDRASPLPDNLLQAGKNAIAEALGERPQAKPQPKMALPPVADTFDKMVQITLGSESRNRDFDDKGGILTSPAGAKGKMQVMDGTNTDPGFGVRPAADNSLAERARVGRDYLAAMLKRYGGDPQKMWAAYNAGPGALDAAIKEHGADWLDAMPAETQAYVMKNVGQLGGQAFNTETGELGTVEAPTEETMNRESAVDYIKRVLGEDVLATPDSVSKEDVAVAGEQSVVPEPVAAPTASAATNIRGESVNEGWTGFAPDSGSLNIPRSEMPQVAAEHRGAMVNFLSARGVRHSEATIPASQLLPTQSEFSEEKVQKAKDFTGGDRAILVSSDGHILDGHHQWLAKRDEDGDVRAIVLDAPISELLDMVHEFPSSTVAPTLDSIMQAEGEAPEPTKVVRSPGYRDQSNNLEQDFLSFIAANGGIRDDEGHGYSKLRNLQRPIAGQGSLIRADGKAADRLRERAVETGWLPEDADIADFNDLFERASFGKIYHPRSEKAQEQINADRQTEDDARFQIESAAREVGLGTFGEKEMGYALENLSRGMEPLRAIMWAMDRAISEDGAEFYPTGQQEEIYVPGFDEERDARETRPVTASSDAQEGGERSEAEQGAAGSSQGAAERPGSSVTIKDTPSGKGIVVSGASDAELSAIKAALPEKASGIQGKDGWTYSKKHEVKIRAALESTETRDNESAAVAATKIPERASARTQEAGAGDAQKAPASPTEDGQFLKVWNSPAFKAVVKALGSPHRESQVAADMVRGWIDGQNPTPEMLDAAMDAAGPLVDQVRESPQRGAGYNPVNPYVEGFYAAVTGKPTEVRTLKTGNKMGVAQALNEIEAIIDPDAVAERAAQISPTLAGGVPVESAAKAANRAAADLRPDDAASISLLARMAEAEDEGRYAPIDSSTLRVQMMIREKLILEGRGNVAYVTSEKGRALLDKHGVKHAQSPAPSAPTAQQGAGSAAREAQPLLQTGDTIRLSKDIEYASAGETYKVEKVGKQEVYILNLGPGGGRTSLKKYNLGRAWDDGSWEKVEQPAQSEASRLADERMAQRVAEAEARGRSDFEAGRKAMPTSLGGGPEMLAWRKGFTEARDAAEAEPKRPSGYGANNRLVTVDRAAELRARLKEKLAEKRQGIVSDTRGSFDPEMLSIGTALAAFHIEAGARKFADFTKAMADDLGETLSDLKPYLRAWYNGARDLLEDAGEDVDGMDGPGAVKAAIAMIEDAAPAAAAQPSDISDISGNLKSAFVEAFSSGRKFATITEARAFAAEVTGQKIEPGSTQAKALDEAIESAVVTVARQIAVRNEGNPAEAYRQLVDLYGRQPKLTVRTSTSVEQQAYSTPVPLAFAASQLAGINQDTTVYEPTAGNGALLIDARPTYVTANELNPDRAAALRNFLRGAKITEEDATDFRPAGVFDAVIANPPFGPVRGDDGQSVDFQVDDQYSTKEVDHAIAMNALKAMKDDGRAVLIVGGVAKTAQSDKARADAYNGKAKREFYFKLYSQYKVTDHFTVSGDLYERQGAGWPVDVIVIEGRGKSPLSLPAVKAPRQYGSWDALAEVLKNDRGQDATRPVGNPDRSAIEQGERPGTADAGNSGRGGERGNDRRERSGTDGQAEQVRDGLVDGQPAGVRVGADGAGVVAPAGDQGQGRTAGRDPARVNPEVAENERQVAYRPGSGGAAMGTLVPVNMQTAIDDALAELASRRGDIDGFVADRLGYQESELWERFGAEQVDAIALAIDNIESGAGFIIGDQTGIGKGRVVAAIIRYAIRQKRAPVFVTEKPNLYADMFRDMTDIGLPEMLGRDLNIVMTNAGESVPLDEDGKRVLKSAAAPKHNALLAGLARDGLGDVDALFTTYNQLQTVKGQVTERQLAVQAIARDAILILDESHNAGGTGPGMMKKKSDAPNRAEFVRKLVQEAHGVLYSSATYAKRPDVMDLYAATDMRLAVDSPDKLGDAIAKGGVPMQQVVAAMLARAGQYVRRERSFDGIAYNTPVVEIDRQQYEDSATIMRSIHEFSEVYAKAAAEKLDEDLRAEAESVGADNAIGEAGASSTTFTSIMHNVINQMLLAFKADAAADMAIDAIKRGEKPVVTVASTLETFLGEYAEDLGAKVGDEIDITFADVFRRYLERSRWVVVKKPFMKKGEKGERVRLTDAQLGPAGVAAFNEGMNLIGESELDSLPGSPLDYILGKIEAAGFKTAEITGRNLGLNYQDGKTYLKARGDDVRSIKGRLSSIRKFNDGRVDVMLLNQSGATGLSLHASKAFKDQRKRRMIIAQAEGNIDTHMQMLGRVHRTGQVVLPEYDQIVGGIPAEKRPAANLAKKMASLNANTTASRDSALTSKEVLDFLNEYGDIVAARLMADEPDIHEALGHPIRFDEDSPLADGAARKVTGRIPLLPVAQQEEIYQRIEEEYKALLEQKEAAGENALEAKTFDLAARTESTVQAVAPVSGSNSPFAAGVDVETVSVKRLGKPYPSARVVEMVAESLDDNFDAANPKAELARIVQATRQMQLKETANAIAEGNRYIDEQLSKPESKSLKKTEDKLRANLVRFRELRQAFLIGDTVRLKTDVGNFYGVVTQVERTGNAKNPLALGAWKATFAVVDSARQITFPFSQLTTKTDEDALGMVVVEKEKMIGLFDIVDAFDEMQTESREERSIVTGNLLAGFDYVNGQGAIINYTTEGGAIRQGIMLRKGFNLAKHQKSKGVTLASADAIMAWLQEAGGEITGRGKNGSIIAQALPTRDVFILTAARAKSQGGEFFLNKQLTAAMGEDFVSKASGMVSTAPLSRARAAIDALLASGTTFEVSPMASDEAKEQAREIAARFAPKPVVKQSEPARLEEPAQPERSMTQAQRGELDARQQQSMARRGGQAAVSDQEGGLFSSERDQDTLFSIPRERFEVDSRARVARDETQLRAVEKKLRAQVAKLGIGDKVTLHAVDKLYDNLHVAGSYGWRTIRIALASKLQAAEFTVDHEAIHALRDLGLFKPSEWTALVKAAQNDRALMKDIRSRYGKRGRNLDEDGILEEAVADMFAIWRDGRRTASGFVRSAFQRILDFLSAVRRSIRGANLEDEVRDILEAIDRGEIGRRPEVIKIHTFGRKGIGVEEPALSLIGNRENIIERLDVWRARLQDRMLPLLRTQQRIEAQSGSQLDEGANPYLQEELMSGKVGAQLDHLSDEMVSPLFEAIRAEGVSVDELETYLYARHAPERNARISDINAEFSEGTGSGMTDQDAASIMARADAEGKIPALERLAERVDSILAFAVDTRVEAGLLTQAEADAWRDQYQFYVPLRGRAEIEPEAGEPDRPHFGSGINVRGPESKRAFGRKSRAADILAYSIMQAEEAIVRAGRNEVAKAFYELAKANPDPDFWTTSKITRKAVWNKASGTVSYRSESRIQPEDEPYTVSLKIDGQERRVTLNRDNPAAVRLAEAMRNLNGTDLGSVLRFMASVNRWLSTVNTGLNPEFVISNAFRDIQTATVNLAQFDMDGLIAGTLKDYRKALVGSVRGAFKSEQGEWGRWYREFVDEGGRVYFNRVDDLNEVRARIEKQFSHSAGGLGAIRGGLSSVFSFIDKANTGVENAIRLSAYKNARELGMTKAQAASLAKNLTVNFNRRGAWGVIMNSMYLFYNASIQGSTRLLQAAFARGRGGKRVRRFLGAAVMTGFALEFLNMMLTGEDDDGEDYYEKISDFEKSRNLVIMIPDENGKYIKIPLPYGYNVFFALGRSAAEMMRGKRWQDSVGNFLSTLADSFNPVGGTSSLLNLAMPTIVDPLVDITQNKDFAGRPIMPEQQPYGPEVPDSQLYWDSVSPHWRIVTELLNSGTGGDDVVPGYVDVSPETLEYLFGVTTGAAGTFYVDRAFGLGQKAVAGEEIDINELPLTRKVVGSKPSWYDKAAYYARIEEIAQADSYIEKYRETGRDDAADNFEDRYSDILEMQPEAKRAQKAMRAVRKNLGSLDKDHDMGVIDDAEYKDRKAELKDQEKAVITDFNTAYIATVAKPKRPD